MSGRTRRLTGTFQLPLDREQAFGLFTPEGERSWSHGWDPRYPVPVTDDTSPGTVFVVHGVTTWVVTRAVPGRRIEYARVTPGDQAGTVTVVLTAAGAHTDVEVTYTLTPLSTDAEAELAGFAEEYPAYLASWREAILARPDDVSPTGTPPTPSTPGHV